MAVQIHQEFGMCLNTEHSPNQSPLSTSPSPEQRHSPRGNQNYMAQEQNLHVIVEPEMNGQTNRIYLINPPTGEMISSMVASHGALIEIQPGVVFQVPYPHEQAYHQPGMPMPHHQHQHVPPNFPPPYAVNVNAQNIQNNGMIPNTYNTHEIFVNENCPMHGCNTNYAQMGNMRAEKRREKLQKKIRDKNNCICKQSLHHEDYNGMHMHDKKILHPENGQDMDSHENNQVPEIEIERDLTIFSPPKLNVESPYTVIVAWEECLLENTHLHGCLFDLQMCDNKNKYKTIFSGQGSSFRACQLQPGTEYYFSFEGVALSLTRGHMENDYKWMVRLCALWNNQRGPFSEPVSCITLITKPDCPNNMRVTQRSKTGLTLKWNAPLSDGGSTITSYTLQWMKGQDGGQFSDLYIGLMKQYKHCHKLPPGTQCLFRVLASNERGDSDWSDILRCLTSAGPPAVPDKPNLVDCGTNFLRLKWMEPDSNGAPVEEYKLEMEDPNDGYGFMVKYHGEKMSYCCQNLRRNTRYTFRLSASNNQGFSRFSIPVSYTTLPEAPGQMDRPKMNGKPRTTAIPVKWDPPRDSGGVDITSYILEVDDGQSGPFNPVYQGADFEYLVGNLQPGLTYRIRVASQSKAGKGSWSDALSATTLPVCPRNCLPPRCAKADTHSLRIEWDPPQDLGGASITNYVIQMAETLQEDDFQEVYSGNKRDCCVFDLLPGKQYFFKTQATNQAGTSQWSSISTIETAPSAPGAPDVPVVTFKTPTHLRMDWSEPVLHGAKVTSYAVEKLENDTFQKVYQGTCCYCEVKRNLNPATHYYFRLQAQSSAGDSPYSSVYTVETPPSVPGPVNEIKVIEQTSSSCLVQWRHPIENGSRVNEYILEATGATSMICTAQRPRTPTLDPNVSLDGSTRSDRSDRGSTVEGESDVELESDLENHATESMHSSETSSLNISKHFDEYMEYRLTGLTADAVYKLRIQAVNSVGNGPFSHPIQFYTKELPPNPPTLNSASVSYHSIKLKWGDSSMKKSMAVLHYNLQVQNKSGSFSSVYNGIGTSYTMSKLNELTPYCCRIRSKNDAGEGDFSKPKIFYTKAQPPAAIKDFHCKETLHTSVKLNWSPLEKVLRHDDVIEYRVQIFDQENSKDFRQVYKGPLTNCKIDDLKPESSYQFRVHAVRILSEAARNSVPSTSAEIKGIFTTLRIKTTSEKTADETMDGESTEIVAEEEIRKCNLTDTHLALIILSTFLLICGLIAGILRWVMGDTQI